MLKRGILFRILTVLSCLILFFGAGALVVSAAEDTETAAEEETEEAIIDYTGELDPATNLPMETSDDAVPTTGRVEVSDSMYYDMDRHQFVYPVANTVNEIYSTAADGMILTKAVSITAGSDAMVTLYRNGSEYTGKLSNINLPGEYVLNIRSGSDVTQLFSFTLIQKTTAMVSEYRMPDGFRVVNATVNGEGIAYDRSNVNMEQEGEYVIEYECLGTEIPYTLEVYIDRTPPELQFSGRINSSNQVRSALQFTGVEEGGSVTVTRANQDVTPSPSNGVYTLSNSGTYFIEVTDAAGNVTSYQFEIMLYFNIGSILFILFAALLLAGIGIYILIRRRSLRIG